MHNKLGELLNKKKENNNKLKDLKLNNRQIKRLLEFIVFFKFLNLSIHIFFLFKFIINNK
jgi:hypothetical protein